MGAAKECKGAAINDNMKTAQQFTPHSSMGNKVIIKSTSLQDIANSPTDSKPYIIKSSSKLSIYDNYPLPMEELYNASSEDNIIEDTDRIYNKEIEVADTNSIINNAKSSHSCNLLKVMNKTRGSLPDILIEESNKQRFSFKISEKEVDANCINKHFIHNSFLHYSSVGDLTNQKYLSRFMETEISSPSIMTASKWQASLEDLNESTLQVPTVL